MTPPHNNLRGRPLHPEIADRVISRFEAGFYDDAVSAAFKVLENRTRGLAGPEDGTPGQVLNTAWNPTIGKLHAATAPQSEREALFALFRGAFGYYRNPAAHRFVDIHEAEALDAIVLVNRLLLITEAAAGAAASLVHSSPEALVAAIAFDRRIDIPYGREDFANPQNFSVDVTGDGVADLVILAGLGQQPQLAVVDGASGQQLPVFPDDPGFPLLEGVATVDIDGDGLPELIVTGGWDTATGFALYKYSNTEFLLMKRCPNDWRDADYQMFAGAHITDFEGDGTLEVVEQPWGPVPSDLIPDNPIDREYGWGYVRYVWRWGASPGCFRLVRRELMSMGAR